MMGYNASPYWLTASMQAGNTPPPPQPLLPSQSTPTTKYLHSPRHGRRCHSMIADSVSNTTTNNTTTTNNNTAAPLRHRRISAPHMNGHEQQLESRHAEKMRVKRKPLPQQIVIPRDMIQQPANTNNNEPIPRPQRPLNTPPQQQHQRLLLRSPLSDRYNRVYADNRSPVVMELPPSPPSTASSSSHTPKHPTFWNPRMETSTHPVTPLHRNLSRRLKGLLQPQKIRVEGASKDQHAALRSWSVDRPMTPIHNVIAKSTATNATMARPNPFLILSHTLPVADELGLDDDDPHDYTQIDTYAANVNQRGPMLTPSILAQKFLARPYRRDLYKIRSIFTWVVQNITRDIECTMTTENDMNESAESVLATRYTKTPAGIARLFCALAHAVGFSEAHIVQGYLRAYRDSIESAFRPDGSPITNHVWCAGEYRLVDCWLALPQTPGNNEVMETHWFLCRPSNIIYTHFPNDNAHQYLEPPISLTTFFSLPYVCMPYFWHHVQVLDYDPGCLDLVNDEICHLTLSVDPDIACFAEVEMRTTLQQNATFTTLETMRGLAQCYTSPEDGTTRLCKIKATLPPDQWMGWLKIYAGPRLTQPQQKITSHHYPLALCFRLTRQCMNTTTGASITQESINTAVSSPTAPFEFVQLHVCQYELYVQEPQCFHLYPLQTYTFRVKSEHSHHKLAIRNPNGRLFKLVYHPHDHTYDGSVKVTDIGQWSLVCLLHHAGGLYVAASWECKG
ncbi:sh3 domain protein [Lichtheimia corymbifera JMRC:FSU:9682]|uniref:Sh3 domain protein n=1 Tax=Lichtheimia corymbifera JMRC:FSU:9682 TaxID=1263082 RepID=A0A068SAL5_9FUNG|nr:sh3 domain protein [Lichtheimia corymbifera JMRC:FSU:9682]